MSDAWGAVLLVGGGSYLLRLLPLLAAGRVVLPDRVLAVLQSAGTAAVAAVLAGTLVHTSAALDGVHRLLLCAALASTAALAVTGRSVPRSFTGGGLVYGLGAAALALAT